MNMPKEELDNGRRLFKALAGLKKQAFGIHPIPQMRPSEFHMMQAIKYCCESQKDASNAAAPPGTTISALSNSVHSSMPAVSQIVRTLDEKELVERIIAKTDRRVVYVCLTPKGKAFLDEEEQQFLSFLNEIADGMGDEDTNQLIFLLDKLQTVLNKVRKNHNC